MGSSSEAFRLIETGGEPRLHPALDYTLCLPLLLSRYSLESAPFLVRYSQTGAVLKYINLDFRLIQRQAKEEIQLEKQNASSFTSLSRARLFETGTPEERARVVLVELTTLLRDHEDQDNTHGKRRKRPDSVLIGNPLYRQELCILLPVCALRCRSPLLDTQAIVKSLRSLQDPAPLIASIILNQPMEFSRTIDALLDTEDPYNNSKAILLRLCKLADHKIWSIRQRLVDRKVFPNLALELTIEHCHDEICFMNRILRGQPEWLTNGVDPVTKSSLSSIMEFVFSSLNDELTSDRPDNVAVNRLLRILSGMVGLMGLSLSAEQLEISLGVLEMTPLESSTIDVKICVVLMCAAQLLKYSQPRVERVLHMLVASHDSPQTLQLVVYFHLQQLLKIDDYASKSLSMTIVIPRGGLMELSALFVSLFASKELAMCALQLGRLPATPISTSTAESSTVSTPTSVSVSRVSVVQPHGHTSDQNTPELRSIANYLVGYLLQQDTFHKSAIDVRTWVMEQIQASTVPLDTNMIHLLRAYTAATARSKHITRIPEDEIRAFFSDPNEDPTPAKVLLVLYMLMNNDVCVANLGSYNMERTQEYDTTLLEYVQIRKVLSYVVSFEGGSAFQAVQPMFLKLVYAQFPELFDVTTLLLEEGLATSSSTTALPELSVVQPIADFEDPAIFMEPFIKAIVHHLDDPEAAVKGYHMFQRLPQKDRQAMAKDLIRASLPSLLDPTSNPEVMDAFKRTWDQLNSVMPHELWALTIHTLLPQNLLSTYANQSTAAQPLAQQMAGRYQTQHQQKPLHLQRLEYYNFEWLVQDPLLLFKVDFRVFRSPIVFRLFVQILGSVMVGSRHWFRKRFHALQAILQSQQNRNPGQPQRRQFKEANLSAMLYIQDSALIQLMLEACQARPEDIVDRSRVHNSSADAAGHGGTKGVYSKDGKKHNKDGFGSHVDEVSDVLKEVRVVTFNFLHQLFIDHKIFPKLVHFQGYALDLLPTTVAGIDSIHVCMDFLQEILFANTPASTASVSGPSGTAAAASASSSGGVGLAGDDGSGRVDVSPQVFALRLAAQLCERFPLPNTMQMATDFILPKLRSLAGSTGFAQDVLESAVVLAKAFPSMSGDIVDLLQEASGPHDKMALMRTIEAINEVLSDPAILDKSLM